MALVIPQFNSVQIHVADGVLYISQQNGSLNESLETVNDVIDVPLIFLNEFIDCIRVARGGEE